MAGAEVSGVEPGSVVDGKYRVEGVVGQGGLATVFMARHTELGQRVALKVLHDAYVDDKELVARFAREARAAVQLRTEHVVKVFDVGTLRSGARKNPYMVMELLEGEDLERVIARAPFAPDAAVDCVLQVCEAVAEAHRIGLIHRDLKPNNLFLVEQVGEERPFLKVLDFGFAKHVGWMDDKAGLTATSSVFGSPHYMSPEQMRASKNVDARTDIWALGACLYEMIGGRTPFSGQTIAEICAAVLKREPTPLPLLVPTLPLGLWDVIACCLSKDPAKRFADVSALAHALEPFAPPWSKSAARIESVLRDPRVGRTLSSRARRRAWWTYGLGGAAAFLLAVGAVQLGARRGGGDGTMPDETRRRSAEHDRVSVVFEDVLPVHEPPMPSDGTRASSARDAPTRGPSPTRSGTSVGDKPSRGRSNAADGSDVRQDPHLKLGPSQRL